MVTINTFKTNSSLDFCCATKPNQKFIIGLPNQNKILNKTAIFKIIGINKVLISIVGALSAGNNIRIGMTAIS